MFWREAQILRRLKDRHIIPLLATYKSRDHFHLILPWAECNLSEYWEIKNPSPAHDSPTLIWMANQCEGIARGLATLHHHATIGTQIRKTTRKQKMTCTENLQLYVPATWSMSTRCVRYSPYPSLAASSTKSRRQSKPTRLLSGSARSNTILDD